MTHIRNLFFKIFEIFKICLHHRTHITKNNSITHVRLFFWIFCELFSTITHAVFVCVCVFSRTRQRARLIPGENCVAFFVEYKSWTCLCLFCWSMVPAIEPTFSEKQWLRMLRAFRTYTRYRSEWDPQFSRRCPGTFYRAICQNGKEMRFFFCANVYPRSLSLIRNPLCTSIFIKRCVSYWEVYWYEKLCFI